MNRREFFSTLAKAAAGFTILPAATTYERIWRVQRPEFIVGDSFTGFEGVEFYNKLPCWLVIHERRRLFAERSIFQFLPAFTAFTTSKFPPNMGEVISTNTNH